MKKLILPATIAAIMATAPLAATADVKLSGQVNRMVAQIDNGVDDEIQHLDNSGSGTRFRLTGEHDSGNGIMVGFNWETQYQSNASSQTDVRATGAQGDIGDSFQPRKRDLYIKGGFGKISIGQGDGAANGIAEYELTGTNYLTGYSSPEDLWGSVTFANSGGLDVGDVLDGMDGLSRNDRLRYDSPKLGGVVTLSFDIGNGGKTEMAARFDTKIGDGMLKGGIGTWDRKDQVAGTSEGMAGSVAYKHSSGFNGALAFGELDTGAAQDPENMMYAFGYQTGVHSFSVRISETENKTANVTGEAMGLGYVNRSLKGTELYAGYQLMEVDVAGAEDITILFGGARVKF